MIVCAYGAKKGIQHIGSVSYLMIFYFILSLYLALLLSTQDSNIHSIFPIWGTGKLEVLKKGTQGLTLFAEFFLFTLLIPYFGSNKEFRKGTWIAFVYVSIQISVCLLIFICLFDKTFGEIGYPFHTAIRYVSLGSYLPNVEIIFFVIWLLSAFIRFTAFLYLNALMFGHIFKIKEFEILIPALATIYLLMGSIPEAAMDVSLEFKPIITMIAGPAFSAIAIILWLVALLKGEFKHGKNRNSM